MIAWEEVDRQLFTICGQKFWILLFRYTKQSKETKRAEYWYKAVEMDEFYKDPNSKEVKPFTYKWAAYDRCRDEIKNYIKAARKVQTDIDRVNSSAIINKPV